MKFHFEYKPLSFRKFVKENFSSVNLLPYPDYDATAFKGNLERLKGQLDMNIDKPKAVFQQWLAQMPQNFRQLLPFIYPDLVNDAQRGLVIVEMQKILLEKKPVFAHMLHQCYSLNEFSPYWSLLSRAYKNNPSLYNKAWGNDVQQVWRNYINIASNHAAHIGDDILKRGNNIEAVMDLYFVREEHAFYRDIFLYIFEHGNLELYKREEKRFTETFKAADPVLAQKLASGFIKANAMDELKDVAQAIYDKLNTYIKHGMYWTEVAQSEKEAFHQWYMRLNIQEFFYGINKEHERFVYWEKYIPRIHDVLVLPDDETILFYFKDVVIMEIIGGGAAYVYERNAFNKHYGEIVEKYRQARESEKFKKYKILDFRLKREDIRNKNYVYKKGWLTHAGDWQSKFDLYLREQLNWEV